MYRTAKIVMMLILFAVLASSTYGLALRGNHLSPIIFEPGKKIVNHYTIDGTDKQVVINLGGDLLEYVTVTEIVNNQFDLIIEVPETLPEPGSYSFSLHAVEMGNPEGIGSLVSVNLIFLVEVPPHGKAISVSFDVPDINEHKPIPFSIAVASKGLEDINSLKIYIEVYDLKNNSVASLTLKERPLSALGTASLSANLPADKLSAGRYWAEALVQYDGEEKKIQDTFKIGNLDLNLVNYSSNLEVEFGEFWAEVENNWGNPIQTISAKIYINGTELLTTPTISLGPWQSGKLEGILQTDFLPGKYKGEIQLSYDSSSKTEEVMFTIFRPIIESEETELKPFLIIAVAVFVVVLAGLISMILRKK